MGLAMLVPTFPELEWKLFAEGVCSCLCLAPAGPLGPVLPWVIGEKFVARSLPRAWGASRRGCGGGVGWERTFFSNSFYDFMGPVGVGFPALRLSC